MTASHPDDADDPMAQIARLREQVETLMRDKVAPRVNELAEQADASAHDASAALRDRAESLAAHVRAQPLTAILLAAAAGFILGRAGK